VAVSSWSPRRTHAGEFVHWYSVQGPWLPDVPEARYLMLMVGEASACAVARFSAGESVEEQIALLQEYLKQFGRPRECRIGSLRMVSASHALVPVEKAAWTPRLHRILKHLEIAWSAPAPANPSGRVEHFVGTTARWLPARLLKAGARSVAEANHYLASVWLPNWNRRFAESPDAALELHHAREESGPTVVDAL
jgi:hypothetical protein